MKDKRSWKIRKKEASREKIKRCKNSQKCKEIQTKITAEMMKLPRNRRILLERETEKERKLLLKEAIKELCKRWRQKKGRCNNQKLQKEEKLKKNLSRIEEEVSKYEEEIKTKEAEEKTRRERLEKKKQKEKHWEMLRWIVTF